MVALGHDPERGGQSWLAKQVGMKPQGIQSILAGDVKRPRLLREIAVALEASEEYLLDEVSAPRGADPDKQLRSALLAYGVDRDDLDAALRAIRGFVSDHHDDEQPQSDQPRDRSGRASRRREPTP